MLDGSQTPSCMHPVRSWLPAALPACLEHISTYLDVFLPLFLSSHSYLLNHSDSLPLPFLTLSFTTCPHHHNHMFLPSQSLLLFSSCILDSCYYCYQGCTPRAPHRVTFIDNSGGNYFVELVLDYWDNKSIKSEIKRYFPNNNKTICLYS